MRSIGELAKEAGVKVPTIRYYEQIGLLAAPPRTDGQQRRYDDHAVSRLHFIRHARHLGFEIDDIRKGRLSGDHDRLITATSLPAASTTKSNRHCRRSSGRKWCGRAAVRGRLSAFFGILIGFAPAR
jgi:DNA-binding transcriptional MerR regulator